MNNLLERIRIPSKLAENFHIYLFGICFFLLIAFMPFYSGENGETYLMIATVPVMIFMLIVILFGGSAISPWLQKKR